MYFDQTNMQRRRFNKQILQNHSAFIHSMKNHEEYDFEKKGNPDYRKKFPEKKCAKKNTRNRNKNGKKYVRPNLLA